MVSTQPVVKNTNKTKARVASPWLHYNRCGWLKRGLTKVIAVVVPALIASPLLLLVQSLFSVFIIFLPQVFVLQNLVGSIHLQELLMGWGVALKHKTGVILIVPGLIRVFFAEFKGRWFRVNQGLCLSWFLRVTHRVFVGVHGESQLLEGPSYLSGRGLPVDSQQLVVVLTLRPNRCQQDDEEQQRQHKLDGTGPLTPEDNPVPHHHPSEYYHKDQQLKRTGTNITPSLWSSSVLPALLLCACKLNN